MAGFLGWCVYRGFGLRRGLSVGRRFGRCALLTFPGDEGKQRRMHLRHGLLLVVKLGDPARLGRGDLDHGLVGHHFDHGLVFLDLITLGHQPFNHLALDDAFADVGQNEVFRGVVAVTGGRLGRGSRHGISGVGFRRCLWRGVAGAAFAVLLHQLEQRCVHLRDVAFLMIQPGDTTLVGRGDFHQGFVGHDLGHRLILFDHIALGHQPFDQFTFHDTFTDIGQYKITHHCSPVRISA